MCRPNLVAEQIWVLVQAGSHLLAETLRIGRWEVLKKKPPPQTNKQTNKRESLI